MPEPVELVSQCLRELQDGDRSALSRLLPLIYEDLRGLAGGIQRRQAHSLNPTALVHEAYARLAHAGVKDYHGRNHFLCVAAMAMRQLLADHARMQRRQKRGGGVRLTLHSGDAIVDGMDLDLVALDEALTELAAKHPRQAKVVELRFLAGLSVEDAAAALEVSPRTVKLDWQMARAWLSRALRRSDEQ